MQAQRINSIRLSALSGAVADAEARARRPVEAAQSQFSKNQSTESVFVSIRRVIR